MSIIADSLMSTSDEMCAAFFVHTMKHCCIRKRYPLHNMRVQVYRTREITSVVYGRNAENEPVSRIKMADYRAVVSMGTL